MTRELDSDRPLCSCPGLAWLSHVPSRAIVPIPQWQSFRHGLIREFDPLSLHRQHPQ